MNAIQYVRKKVAGKRARTDNSEHSSHSQSLSQSQGDDDEEVQMEHSPDQLPEQPAGETYGIHFIHNKSVTDFVNTRHRKICNTRFFHKQDMKTLGIHDGIVALFKNIGWDGFLSWDEVGYIRPTHEFLSSCTFSLLGVMRFRVYNQSYSITRDQICDLAQAPTQNTFYSRYRANAELDLTNFWRDITGQDNYDPSHAKISSIIHPTLKVAARLLVSSVFAREEAGSINKTELFILARMIHHTGDMQTPNFGDFLLWKIDDTRGVASPTHSAGLITKILKHPDLGIHIPDNEPKFLSERYLGIQNLARGKILKEDNKKKTFTWTVGAEIKIPYLCLKRQNFKILKLKKPISATNWIIPPNMESDQPRGNEGASTSRPAPEPARHSEASYFTGSQSNYDRLHSDYQGLHGLYTSLHGDYSALHGSYSSMSSDYSTLRSDVSLLRTDFDTERTANTSFRQEVRTFMSDSALHRSQQGETHDMVSSFFRWHISEHPGYAPQPPPPAPPGL